MDNDDLRRGRPTNHKVFGESFALLAGDGLLSEAFSVLATHYLEEPSLLASLLDALTRAVGIHGMVGGQSMDLVGMEGGVSQRLELETLHKLKTGALIQVSAVGSAIICGAGGEKLEQVGRFAQGLGLAFQVWDDLLDYDSESVEKQSFPGVLGIEASREYLRALNESTLSQLESWGTGADSLRWLVHYNETRSH
jgi:geranylgeranyl diphosphate synthase type II